MNKDDASMNEIQQMPDEGSQPAPAWQPLTSRQRRVVGVLIEKAKTTRDAYPLTLNALTNGCNQKSNRSPQMTLSPDDVETVLDELRELGAVTEVQSSGRVAKFRHQMYEWLGVDKVELAVMAELLLRGEQTVGELRGRASRMEPIASAAELRPILQSLIAKRLVIALTPEGRGQIVSHGLYRDRELEQLRARLTSSAGASPAGDASVGETAPEADQPATVRVDAEQFEALSEQVRQLSDEVRSLQDRLDSLEQLLR
jgi:uncharacterized protein YceH (UPF0502 family)